LFVTLHHFLVGFFCGLAGSELLIPDLPALRTRRPQILSRPGRIHRASSDLGSGPDERFADLWTIEAPCSRPLRLPAKWNARRNVRRRYEFRLMLVREVRDREGPFSGRSFRVDAAEQRAIREVAE
jgi:hypothetical protein